MKQGVGWTLRKVPFNLDSIFIDGNGLSWHKGSFVLLVSKGLWSIHFQSLYARNRGESRAMEAGGNGSIVHDRLRYKATVSVALLDCMAHHHVAAESIFLQLDLLRCLQSSWPSTYSQISGCLTLGQGLLEPTLMYRLVGLVSGKWVRYRAFIRVNLNLCVYLSFIVGDESHRLLYGSEFGQSVYALYIRLLSFVDLTGTSEWHPLGLSPYLWKFGIAQRTKPKNFNSSSAKHLLPLLRTSRR